jgi:RHS repeat-associated protein
VTFVLLLVLSLAVSLVRDVPAIAAPPSSPDAGSRRSVPVHSVAPRAATKSATDGPGITVVPPKKLPSAASGTVPVSGSAVKVGDLPVTFGPAASSPEEPDDPHRRKPSPASVQVRVLDQAATDAAGVSGPLLALTRADGVNASGRVRVRLDYQEFADAFGGDQAGRLRLVKLPECALSTPGDPGCQVRTDLGAVNSAGALSADVTLAAGSSVTVLAVIAGASSDGATFEATSLSQAYSWTAGNLGGSFTYNYQLRVPPAGVGPQPNLALTYDSGVADGQTLAQNGQASWIGEGWDLQVGYIERAYRPCAQDDAGPVLVGDLCWFSPHNATMLFGGRSLQLVRDDGSGGWRAANDDGLRIEKLNDRSLRNGDDDGEYWKVTTQEGTQYFFGKNKRYSNDNEKTNSVQTVAVYGDDPDDPCGNSLCREAYRWNLDYVVDPRGNTMTYVYNLFQGKYRMGTGATFPYDLAANLAYIDYGDVAGTEHSQPAPMRIQFETTNRCVGACTTNDYPDTPWDLYCAPEAFSCNNRSPIFFNNKKLSSITAMVRDPVDPPKYRTVDKWVLSHTFPDTGDNIAPIGKPDTPPNLWLQSIEHTGYAVDGTPLTEPKMEFGGEMSANRVDWGDDIGIPPYMHYRLSMIRTGTGAETLVTYARSPDGGTECHRLWQPIPDNNPHLCFPQFHKSADTPPDADAGFGWFFKYVARVVRERDLTGESPDEWTFYSYAIDGSSDSALWYHDFNETVLLKYRTWSLWRGYSTVTATKEVSEGTQTVSRNLYHRGMDGDGKTSSDGLRTEWGSRRVGLLSPIGTPHVDGAISGRGGKCLDIQGGDPTDGTPVVLWTCNDSLTQVWDRQPPPDRSLKNPESGKCLDISGGGTANGTPIQISTCTGAASQVWQPRPDGGFENPQSGRCLDLTDFDTADGARIQLWDCTGNWNQVWQPQAVGRKLSNPQANRCIDIQDGADNGTKIQSWACTGEDDQVWQWQSDGSFKNPQTGRCLTIADNGTANGSLIQLWDCTGGANQVWQPQPDGSLKNPQSGRCLEAGVKASGQLIIYDCNGGLTQKWVNRFLDARGLYGFLRDGMSLDGENVASSMIHVPTATQTATRARPATGGQDLYADLVRETLTKTRTWIAADSRWRWTEARSNYDSYGLPTDASDLGDDAVTDDETCVRTEYARNTAQYLVAYPWQVTEYAGTCGSDTLLARSQTRYENTALGVAPTKGLSTTTQLLTAPNPDVWATTHASYDTRGRPITNIDARGQTTQTSYTPPGNLPLKEITVRNPLGHTAKTTLDPGRGQPIQQVDANGKLTTTEYDPLGRRTAVWLPTEKKASGDPPSQTYQYEINTSAPHKLTTRVLQSAGVSPVYLTSYTYLDGRWRTRNTQIPSPAGGRIVTETSYDARGQIAALTAPFFNIDAAGSGMVAADPANVPSRTVYSYDNLQRRTVEALQSYGAEKWHTTYRHDGDRSTTIPPSGGASTRTWDAAERTTSLAIYPTSSTVSTSGTAETTRYGYNRADELTTITDAAGNVTRYGYDLAGNRTTVEDPDTATTISTYNPAGDLLTLTDARSQKLSYQYDELGRITTRWAGEAGTGTKQATFTYDSLAKGQLTSASRFVGVNEYKIEPIDYDDRYRPTGTRWVIPASEGPLRGTYETRYGYDGADHLTAITYPQRAGLPAETVTTGYDALGYATTLTGATNYTTSEYDPTGLLISHTYGDPGPGQLRRDYGWDPATGWLDTVTSVMPNPAQPDSPTIVQSDSYSYLPAGDISSIKDSLDGQSQCYRYDGQHRLTEAYTTIETCDVDPTNVAASGKHPYWDSFAFDEAGRRTADTHRTATAITGRTYTYPTAGQPRIHAMQSAVVDADTDRTDTFGYDTAGNMTTRTVQGVKSDYTIDAEGRFETATVHGSGGDAQTRHVYDPDGGLLIRETPAGRSLYLGNEEIKDEGGNAVTGIRYYAHDGAVVAVRTSTGVSWLAADHQASADLTVNAATGAVQRRWYLPYGGDRAEVTGWPTDRGFLNGQTNTSTKLLDLSAREYDPDTGAFIAPDALIDPGDPRSFNPYAYAFHNPVTLSDPTGLSPDTDADTTTPSKDDIQGDQIAAVVVVAALVVLAIAVCAGTGGLGCAVMAGAALGAGFSAATAEEGQRARAAVIGGVAGAIAGGVGGLLAGPAGIAATSSARLAAAGVAAGVTEDATYQYLSTGTVDWRQTAMVGALGGVLGPAGKIAGKFAGRVWGRLFRCHSFAPTTGVLMADGSIRAIKDVELGDQVVTTDPDTGETEAKPVEQLHQNHDTDLTDLTVTTQDTTPDGGADAETSTVLHTTQHHPFWDETADEWADAANITIGHQLRTTNGDVVTVTAVHNYTGGTDMRDLTIADIHTYYVMAGDTPVLVHNCNGLGARWGVPRKPGVYIIELKDGNFYIGSATNNMRARVTAAGKTARLGRQPHALEQAGYTADDVVNVRWQVRPGNIPGRMRYISRYEAWQFEQDVMDVYLAHGHTIINRDYPVPGIGPQARHTPEWLGRIADQIPYWRRS